MKKTILFLLFGALILCTPFLSFGQSINGSKHLSKAISKVEMINSLNRVYPNDQSYKTTSTDRAIKVGVRYYSYDSGSGLLENYDSVVYTNEPGRYSELSRFEFGYYPSNPEDVYTYPQEISDFAGNTAVEYRADGTRIYGLSDSSSYTYNSNGNLSSIYQLYNISGSYDIANYTYDAANKLTGFEYQYFLASGVLQGSGNAALRYGSNYVVLEYDGGSIDSARLDASGRTIALYSDDYYEEYTYDGNGYLTSYTAYDAGVLESSVSMSFDPNYKQYSYEEEYYDNGSFVGTDKYILVGQAGLLDSVYIEEYDTAGTYIGSYYITDVTMDSYGNVISTNSYDDTGNLTEWYRYTYEDVVTGVSDLSTPFTDLKIYPNPATQSDITISTAEDFSSVTISSISGQKLIHSTFRPRSEMQLHTSTLSPGNYTITIRSDDGRESTQVFAKM